jgi:hypothetical protein
VRASRYAEFFRANTVPNEAYAVTLTDGSTRWGVPQADPTALTKFRLTIGGQSEQFELERVEHVTRLLPCPVSTQTDCGDFLLHVSPEQAFGAVLARGITHVLGVVLEPANLHESILSGITISGVEFVVLASPKAFGNGGIRLDVRRRGLL